jgi:transcriptional regulator with XRE-family HTH domain
MEGDLQEIVGENLRRLRLHLGHSQESFGEHVGWHRTFVGAVERGERNLTLRTVERLAAQLDVDPLSLLFDGAGGFRPLVEGGIREAMVTFAADGPAGAEGAEGTEASGSGSGDTAAAPLGRAGRSRSPRPR